MKSEVGSGQVAIFPTFKGFRKNVSTEVDGATSDGARRFSKGFSKAGSDAGTSTGKGFKAAFASSSKNTATATLNAITKEVASASRALSTSRLKEQDATGKVRVAEAALAEARTKSGAGSARSIAAEERLATAQRALGVIQSTVKVSTDALATSQTRLAAATTVAEAASKRSGISLSGFFNSLRNNNGLNGAIGVVGDLSKSIGNGLVSALSFAASKFVTTAKVGITAFTGLIALIGGLSIKGGITRLLNIEDAQAKLKGLGNSTEAVAEIMNDALSSVKGTFFTLDDAATVAATAVAAGIKPGKDLTKYLSLTADAATIAGTSLGDLGDTMNNVTTVGAAYNDSLQVIAQRGIPIYQYLSDELGISTAAVKELASEGKISSEQFRKALEDNIGGAALSAGDTTRGAFANMQAAMSRAGASLVKDSLPQFQTFFTKVGEFFDGTADETASAGKGLAVVVGQLLDDVLRVLKALDDVSKMDGGFTFKNIRTQFEGAFPGLKGLFDIADALRPVLPALAKAFEKVAPALVKVIPPLSDLAIQVLPVMAKLIPVVTKALTALVDFASTVSLPLLKFGLDAPGLLFSDKSDGEIAEQMQSGMYGPILAQLGFFAEDWDKAWDKKWGHGAEQITGFFTSIGASFANGWSQITTFFGTIFTEFGNFQTDVRGFFTGLASTVWTGIGTVVGFFAALPGRIGSALAGAGSWLLDTGKNIVQGLIDGVTGMLDKAVKAVKNVGGAMLDGVKSFLGIHSPSRRFKVEVGEQIGQGVIDGVQSKSTAASTAAQRLVSIPNVPTRSYLAQGTASTNSSPDRPIYMEGSLFGWMRETAEGVTKLILNQYGETLGDGLA